MADDEEIADVYDLVRSRRVPDIDVDAFSWGVWLVGLDVKTAGACQEEQPNDQQKARASSQRMSASEGSERPAICALCSTRFPQHDGRLLCLAEGHFAKQPTETIAVLAGMST